MTPSPSAFFRSQSIELKSSRSLTEKRKRLSTKGLLFATRKSFLFLRWFLTPRKFEKNCGVFESGKFIYSVYILLETNIRSLETVIPISELQTRYTAPHQSHFTGHVCRVFDNQGKPVTRVPTLNRHFTLVAPEKQPWIRRWLVSHRCD